MKNAEEEVFETIRFFSEEADHLQGFHFLTDIDSGFGGLSLRIKDHFLDEYPRKPILTFPMWPSFYNDSTDTPFNPLRNHPFQCHYVMIFRNSILLTPGVDYSSSSKIAIQSATQRGSQTKFNLQEYLSTNFSTTYNYHNVILDEGSPVGSPYPQIFDTSMERANMITSWNSSNSMEKVLENISNQAEKLNLQKMNRFLEAGLEERRIQRVECSFVSYKLEWNQNNEDRLVDIIEEESNKEHQTTHSAYFSNRLRSGPSLRKQEFLPGEWIMDDFNYPPTIPVTATTESTTTTTKTTSKTTISTTKSLPSASTTINPQVTYREEEYGGSYDNDDLQIKTNEEPLGEPVKRRPRFKPTTIDHRRNTNEESIELPKKDAVMEENSSEPSSTANVRRQRSKKPVPNLINGTAVPQSEDEYKIMDFPEPSASPVIESNGNEKIPVLESPQNHSLQLEKDEVEERDFPE
ncbi:unnamed protein product [Lepeophtheirus salmonis]|uniref:(salmon louse) hypothetical protein n=1 Tax=Lepeophtheirus salmonis TaxID=72036 RepID=A0A7R8CMH3_LEPSM|nr:unnamed protein product [Lepeophtheirus salmonis]CAF2864298.1 unnamed protein product [Lepeophtheirus salmonis]